MSRDADLWCVRTAEPHDFEAILFLLRRESNRIGHLPGMAIATFIHGRCAHVAEHIDHGVIGYIGGRPSMRYDRTIRPVTQLVVHRDHRRQGIATELVTAVMLDANRAGQSMLQAWSRDDLDAKHLWADLGWTAVAQREPHTARRIPATLWRLPLTQTAVASMWVPPPVGGYRAARSEAQMLLEFPACHSMPSRSAVRSLTPAKHTTAVTS